MDVDFHMIRTMVNMLLSVKSKHCFWRCTASWLSLVLNIVNQHGPGSSDFPPYSNATMNSIHYTRVSCVIRTAFSYLSVKFQLNVWQNRIMFLLNYTLPKQANLPILPWFVKREIIVLKCIVDFFHLIEEYR